MAIKAMAARLRLGTLHTAHASLPPAHEDEDRHGPGCGNPGNLWATNENGNKTWFEPAEEPTCPKPLRKRRVLDGAPNFVADGEARTGRRFNARWQARRPRGPTQKFLWRALRPWRQAYDREVKLRQRARRHKGRGRIPRSHNYATQRRSVEL